MSKRGEIITALANRLAKLTLANGYSIDVKKVFYDDIPLGIDLQENETPGIIILDKECRVEHSFSDLSCEWFFELQLIHGQVPDTTMLDFTRDVLKVLFCDSPTGQVTSYLRFHPAVYDLHCAGCFGDLHTIEANRFAIMELIVFFDTKIWEF